MLEIISIPRYIESLSIEKATKEAIKFIKRELHRRGYTRINGDVKNGGVSPFGNFIFIYTPTRRDLLFKQFNL